MIYVPKFFAMDTGPNLLESLNKPQYLYLIKNVHNIPISSIHINFGYCSLLLNSINMILTYTPISLFYQTHPLDR